MGHLWKWTSWGILVVLWAQGIFAPPTNKQAPANQTVPDHPDNQEKPEDDMDTKYSLEYNRYLKEVVDALESDPEFRKKLETAEDEDFRNGKVAAELEYVNHHVRTKLDELKRTELNRLRELLKMEEERKKAEEDPHHHGHVDHSNPHTFEVQDLQNLMNKVRMDLEKADAMRKEDFKEYEMQKEFEKEQKMKSMDEEHKKDYIKELEEEKKKAQQHDPVRPVHHPGSKAQLEEVWEKSDHMTQNFDPKAFFYLHDLDGNGYWDEQEVNALFLKELEKIYAYAGNNHVDSRERQEEMERMREHVFKETDTNRDRFISFEEFLEQTKRDEWRRDEGWESIDQKPQFTQQEYEEFERRRQAEIQRMIQAGQLPAHPAGLQPPYQYVHPNQLPPGAHPNMQYQPVHPAGVPINQAQYQYQTHPAAGQQQYQAHPAAGQYQAHPAAGQQQYQAHPAAGQQPYQAHPAAGQQQYQAHPAAGQQQYQAHPAAGQPQYQAQPGPGQPGPGQPHFQPQPPAGQSQFQAPPAPAQPVSAASGQHQPSAGQQTYQQQPQQYQQQPPAGQQYQQQPPAGQQYQQQPPAGQQYQQQPPAGQQYQQQPPAGQQYQQQPPAGKTQYQAQPAPAQPSANQPPPPNPANSQPVPAQSQQQQQHQQIPNHPDSKSNEIPGKP